MTALKWFKSRKGQQTLIILAFMIIPLALLFIFTYLPFGEMVKFSFYKMKYTTPVDKRVFVGLKNYAEVFRNKDIFASLTLSLYYMAGSIVQLALALYLATILSFKTKGGNFFKGLMFFPYLISGIAIGFIFKYFYTRGFVFDTILGWCGFDLESLPYWLKDQKINNWSLVATSVWRYFGNNMVLFIGAIMSVDAEMYEAAELDGANKFQQFLHIILPSIKTIVTLNVILSINMNRIAHTNQKVGLASAMAVVLLLIIFACTILQKLFFKYIYRNADQTDEVMTKEERKRRKEYIKQKKAAKKGAA